MCGEGLGHTGRCLALGKEFLNAGHEVNFGAYRYSKKLAEKAGYSVYEIPSEFKLAGEAGVFNIKKSVIETLRNFSPSSFKKLLNLFEKLKPDVVISDGYYTGILAAQKKNIPVYFVGHQFNMEEFFKKQGFYIKLAGKFTKRFYNYIFSSVNGIIIPDYPLPYSVNRKNFTLRLDINKTIFFCGPLIRYKYHEIQAENPQFPTVLSTIGAFGYREAIFRNVIEAAKLDPNINYIFILGPGINSEKFVEFPDNVKFVDFTENPFPYYKSSDLVISAGGHGTIMESLSFGLPVISFPDEKHIEQENNASVLEEAGYGKRMSYLTRPEVILTCIRELIEEEQYKRKTQRLMKLSEILDGPGAVRKLLEDQIGNKSKI
jgi:uncharacterized protein (TIGR00661 family)